jgi:hypothetical protein
VARRWQSYYILITYTILLLHTIYNSISSSIPGGQAVSIILYNTIYYTIQQLYNNYNDGTWWPGGGGSAAGVLQHPLQEGQGLVVEAVLGGGVYGLYG